MTTNEVRAAISQGTGIPEYKLPDTTLGTIIQHAQTILAQQRQEEAQRPKSTAEQFAAWFNAQQGIDPQAERYNAAQAAIDRVVEQLRVDAGGYPIIRDGGSSGVTLGDCRINIVASGPEMPIPIFVFQIRVPIENHEATFSFEISHDL